MKFWKAALVWSTVLMCSGCDALNGLIASKPECSVDAECGSGKWCSSKAQCVLDTDKEELRLRVNRILSGVESYPGEDKGEDCEKVDALMYRFIAEASASDSSRVHSERVKAAVSFAKRNLYHYISEDEFKGYEDVSPVCELDNNIVNSALRQRCCIVWKFLADEGIPVGLLGMGLAHLLCDGSCDAPDFVDSKRKARVYLEQAAAKGNMKAICILGQEGCSLEDYELDKFPAGFEESRGCDYTEDIGFTDEYDIQVNENAIKPRLKQVFAAEDGSKTEFAMRKSIFDKYIEKSRLVDDIPLEEPFVYDGSVASDKYTDLEIVYSPETSDHYNRKAVRYPFSRNVVALMGCYDRMPREPEQLEGRITLKASIDTEGKVTQASFVDSTFNNEAFGRCLVDDMKAWIFPKSAKQAAYEVTTPIEYKWHTPTAAKIAKIEELDPEIRGVLDKRFIRNIVRQHAGELRACYEKGLVENKDLAGSVSVSWIIVKNGFVDNVVIKETTLKNNIIETCITDNVKRWRFPQPKDGGIVSVVYPFKFYLESE